MMNWPDLITRLHVYFRPCVYSIARRLIDTWAAPLEWPIKVDYHDFILMAGEVRENHAANQVYVVE